MKLDRNIEGNDGRGKYAILNLRKLSSYDDQKAFGGLPPHISGAITTLCKEGILEWGDTPQDEFFVIKLKDKYAATALVAYATVASEDDPEYAHEMMELAERSGPAHPLCKRPD